MGRIVLQAAERFSDEGIVYAMYSAVEAFTQIGTVEAVPWLRERFADAEYFILRWRCVVALEVLDPVFPDTLALECL